MKKKVELIKQLPMISLATVCMMTNTTNVNADMIEGGLYDNGLETKVHIKKIEEHISATDIKDILQQYRLSTMQTSVKEILDNKIAVQQATTELPRTDELGTQQSTTSGTSSDDGLTYSKWLDATEPIKKHSNVHSWSTMGYYKVKDKSTNQYKYLNSGNAFTDEYGFRKYKYNDHEYYFIAVASYYACDGVTPASSEWKESVWNNSAGHAIQVKLEDGNIINCIIGDLKKNEETVSTGYTGHPPSPDDIKKGTSKNAHISIVETIADRKGDKYLKASIPNTEPSDSAYITHHKGSPWTSKLVALRLGPVIPLA